MHVRVDNKIKISTTTLRSISWDRNSTEEEGEEAEVENQKHILAVLYNW